jgi:hypothetical protein
MILSREMNFARPVYRQAGSETLLGAEASWSKITGIAETVFDPRYLSQGVAMLASHVFMIIFCPKTWLIPFLFSAGWPEFVT